MKTPLASTPRLRALFAALVLLVASISTGAAEWITLQVPLTRATNTFKLWEVAPGAAAPNTLFPVAGPDILKTSVTSIEFIGGSFDALGNWIPDQDSYALVQAERAGTGHFWLRDETRQDFAPRDQTALTAAPWTDPASTNVFRQFSIESARAGHGLSLQFASGTAVTYTMSLSPPQVEYDISGQPADLGFFLAWVPDTGTTSGDEWIIDHDTGERTSGTALPANLIGAAWEPFNGTTPTHQVVFLIPTADSGDTFEVQIPGVSVSQTGATWWEGTAPDNSFYSGPAVTAVVGQNYWFQLYRVSDSHSSPGFRMGEADLVLDARPWLPPPPEAQWETRGFSMLDALANQGTPYIRYADGSTTALSSDGGYSSYLYAWDDWGNEQNAMLLGYTATIDVNRTWWVEQARGGTTVHLGQDSVFMEGWAPSHASPPAGSVYAWVPAVRQGRALRSGEGWLAPELGDTTTFSLPSPVGGAPITWDAVRLWVSISNPAAPFTLSDPVAGDISPPAFPGSNSGTADFSAWFPPQPLILKISATRWGKNLVIRTPLGADRPITRHQMQGDWSRDASSGTVWFNPYGYFDATATAYEGLPWWLVDLGVAGHPTAEVLTPAAGSVNDFIASTDSTNSDPDSLKDWEERLLGTNPYSADTDGDGTNDDLDTDPRTLPATAPGSTLKVYTQLR